MKRLMAVLMAVAMVLSLSVTAFAEEVEDTREVENLDVGDTVDGSSGGTEATSTTEGRIPDDPIDIVLPVVAAAGEGEVGAFDMYLDPHELITKTGAARYDALEATFAGNGQRLYFSSDDDEEGGTVYSGDSKTLTITNKGRLPVTVDLNVDMSYGEEGEEAEFALVSSAADLEDATKAPNAAMFLGLKLGTNDPVAVLEPAANAVPSSQVYGKGNYFTSVAFAFADGITDANKTALLTALEGASIVGEYVALVPAQGENQAEPAKVNVKPTMTGYTFAVGETAVTADGVDVEEADASSNVKTLALTVKKDSTAVATITVKVLPPNRKTMKETDTENGADYTQTIKFFPHAAGTGKAFVRTAISSKKDAYTEMWTDPTAVTEDNPAPQGMSAKGYYWAIKEELAEEAEGDDFFPSISFKLTGNINDDVLWDAVDDGQISFNLTWDVFEHDNAMYQNVAFGDGAEPSTPRLSGTAPTIVVTKQTTGSSNATAKTVTITWTPGTEDYAAYTPSTSMVLSNGSTLTMTIDNNAHTLKNTNAYATVGASGVTGTVVFTADGLADIELETTALR